MGRHGDGSITQRKAADGRTVFDAWWTYTDPETGARKRAGKRGFATQTAAGKHLRRVTVTVDAGTYVKVSRVTLGAYLAEWIATVRLKPQTVIGYKDKIRLHIDPHLGHLPLAEIRGHQLNALYRKLETEGSPGGRGKLSLSTVREVHAILSSAYTAAIKEGRLGITVSPTKQASPPKARDAKAARPSYVTWTGPQVREFLAQTADDHYGMIWRFLAATGCRRGEALGLSWADVNMARGTATLRTTIGEGRKTVVDPDGTAREVRVLTTGSLKSDRPRVVSLDPETLAHLEAHRGRPAACPASACTTSGTPGPRSRCRTASTSRWSRNASDMPARRSPSTSTPTSPKAWTATLPTLSPPFSKPRTAVLRRPPWATRSRSETCRASGAWLTQAWSPGELSTAQAPRWGRSPGEQARRASAGRVGARNGRGPSRAAGRPAATARPEPGCGADVH